MVASGELTETTVTERRAARKDGYDRSPDGSLDHVRGPHVHDLINIGDRPAISVHAYAPRLTAMTDYDVDNGRLVTGRTVRYRFGAAIP